MANKISSKTTDEIDDVLRKDMLLIEAVLFVSGRYLSMKDIVAYSDLNPIMVREVMNKLKEKYNTDENSALRIVEKGEQVGKEMWKMDVKQEFSYLSKRLAGGSEEFTKAEQETLAIIAFKQPIKQSVVVKIRGNKSYDHIDRFNELGLIKKKREGRTYELTLSDEFYDYFDLEKSDSNENKELKLPEPKKGEE